MRKKKDKHIRVSPFTWKMLNNIKKRHKKHNLEDVLLDLLYLYRDGLYKIGGIWDGIKSKE